MKILSILFLFIIAIIPTILIAQKPDLSKLHDAKEKINAWLAYCESLKTNDAWMGTGFSTGTDKLQKVALEGLKLVPASDAENRSRFFAYAAQGYYHQIHINSDSVEYYFYESLKEATKAKSAPLIMEATIALMHIGFELQESKKVDSLKTILQSIIDTTSDKAILRNGYSALGSYFQQKSYYSTAQDYFIKSIELRKKQIDTTQNVAIKKDYVNQCYTLAQLYLNTGNADKSINMLYEGERFKGISPLMDLRYYGLFVEAFCKNGTIDSALAYMQRYINPLEEHFKNNPIAPAEIVFSNLAIAKYYIERKLYGKAFPYLDKGNTLGIKSNEPLFAYQGQELMGRYFLETGQFIKAVSLLSIALPVAKQFSREDYSEGLKYLALSQKAVGNTAEALSDYSQYTNELDTLTKEKISRNLADEETRYETNQKEERIVTLSKENQLEVLQLQNAARTRLFLILGLAALGVIALLLYFIYRNKEKLNKILNERNNQLDILNHDLALANDTKAKLFGIIGHDLRAPVSQIVQLLHLQKEKPDLLTNEARAKHEEKLKVASENVLETMEDLLLWSKSQMQHFTPQFRQIRIADVLNKEINLLKQQAEEKNIHINQQVQGTFTQTTDENFLSVIIRNLLQNAVKYSDNAGTITISANDNSISITNQAAKANADELNALLNSKQVDSKRSGLGLQIANDLVISLKAKIFFEENDHKQVSAVLKWS